MSKVRVTKKAVVLFVVLGSLILGSGVGYLVWRVNQEEQLSSEESEAGNDCGHCNCNKSCPSGCHTCDGHHNNACGEEPGENAWCCCKDAKPGQNKCDCNCGGWKCSVASASCGERKVTGCYCSGRIAGCDGGKESCFDGIWSRSHTLGSNGPACSSAQIDCNGGGGAAVAYYDHKGNRHENAGEIDWSLCTSCEKLDWSINGSTLNVTAEGLDIDGENVRFRVSVKADGAMIEGFPKIVASTSDKVTCVEEGKKGRSKRCTLSGAFDLGSSSVNSKYSIQVDVADENRHPNAWKTSDICKGEKSPPPACESLDITTTGKSLAELEETDELTVTVNGRLGNSPPSWIHACVTVRSGTLTTEQYLDGQNWLCYQPSDGTYSDGTLVISGLTFAGIRDKLVNRSSVITKEQVDNRGLSFVAVIGDDENNQKCNTNVAYFDPNNPNGSGILIIDDNVDPNVRCDGDMCVEDVRLGLEKNPGWDIIKTSEVRCIDDYTENARARVDYDIAITNTGDGVGILNKVDDKPTDVKNEWLVSGSVVPEFGEVITSGEYIDNITWDLVGAESRFDPGETKHYKYSIVVPKDYFKSYYNITTGYPEEGSNFSDDEDIWATCNVPGAGLFDSVASKIVLGLVLVMLGIVYLTFTGSDRMILRFYYRGKYKKPFRWIGNGKKDRKSKDKGRKIRENFEKGFDRKD